MACSSLDISGYGVPLVATSTYIAHFSSIQAALHATLAVCAISAEVTDVVLERAFLWLWFITIAFSLLCITTSMSLIWRFSTVPTCRSRQLIEKTASFLFVPNATLIYSTLAAVGGTILWCIEKGRAFAFGLGAVFVLGTLLHNYYDAKIQWAWEECKDAESVTGLNSQQPALVQGKPGLQLRKVVAADALRTEPALVHACCAAGLEWQEESGHPCQVSPNPTS